MLRNNSNSLQDMINRVPEGHGNISFEGMVTPPPPPYPSPMDMAQGYNQQYGYQPMMYMNPYGYQQQQANLYAPPQNPYKPQQVQQPNPIQPQGFRIEDGMVHIPGQQPFRDMTMPSEANMGRRHYMVDENGQMYIPGQTRPGRCMDVPTQMKPLTPPPAPDLAPTCSYTSDGQKIHTIDTSFWSQQYQAQQEWQKRQPRPGDFYGTVNIINGQIVHPHANDGWYGQEKASDIVLKRVGSVDPFQSNYGVNRQPQIDPAIRRQMIDDANVAAFYGMSYYEYMEMNAHGYRMMSECVSKILGRSKEETEKRAKQYDFDPDQYRSKNRGYGDDILDHPFDPDGRLSAKYIANYCVNRERLKDNCKRLKIAIKRGDEVIARPEVKYEDIEDYINKSRQRERATASANYWHMVALCNISAMHENAPEKEVDKTEGNVFDITLRTLEYPIEAYQKKIDENQQTTYTGMSYSHDDYLRNVRRIYKQNKRDFTRYKEAMYTDVMSRASPDLRAASTGRISFMDTPYIQYEGSMYAPPGVDVLGIPLSKSKGRIVRVNTENGEEEMYDPYDEERDARHALMKERILQHAMHKDFREYDEEEKEVRQKAYKASKYEIDAEKLEVKHGTDRFFGSV